MNLTWQAVTDVNLTWQAVTDVNLTWQAVTNVNFTGQAGQAWHREHGVNRPNKEEIATNKLQGLTIIGNIARRKVNLVYNLWG